MDNEVYARAGQPKGMSTFVRLSHHPADQEVSWTLEEWTPTSRESAVHTCGYFSKIRHFRRHKCVNENKHETILVVVNRGR